MPGGIGPMNPETLAACFTRGREIDAPGNANEIFFNLDGRRVYYDSGAGYLYFVNAPGDVVLRTVRSAAAGAGSLPVIEQLHLDVHKCFNAACRVRLQGALVNTVLMALRLAGVHATVR